MNDYDLTTLIISYYYLVFMIVAVSANSLLMFLIKCRSPHIANGFKIILINTAANEVLLAVMQSALQVRLLPSGTVLALLPAGPLRHLGPTVCFIAYNVINALNLNIGISVFHSTYFRYRVIKDNELSSEQVQRNLLVSFMLPIFVAAITCTSPFHFDTVMEVAIQEHPEYSLREYGPFGGFSSTTNPLFVLKSMILFIASVALPATIFHYRRLIVKALSSPGAALTEKTRENSRILLQGLTAQALIPLLCIVPIVLLYFISQFNGNGFAAGEFLMPIFTTLHCAIGPLFTIYFITPYREWVINLINHPVQRFRLMVSSLIQPRTQNTFVNVVSKV
ncbi:7TM chemoreceptor [Oesophagostomum dentatum]|uniref:7TM chemoreceptor n=1 Tax=Oesophagostomum dentatum TaxID=61180 RepID=A0A0B1TEJ5_OESDE|nr:7TM chemoreceptor [Oesophagostomum dentatum]